MTGLVHEVAELFRKEGPWCTIHLDVSTGTVDTLEAMDLAGDHVRETLLAAGASKEDAAAAAAIQWRAEGLPAPVSRFVLIRQGGVEVNETCPGAPVQPLISVGPIPNLMPLAEHRGSDFNYLVVEVDRASGEIRLYCASNSRALATTEIAGDTENLQNVPGSGRAQSHYQHRTKEIWRRNADLVAEEVDKLVLEHAPALVVLAGDVRARELVQAQLGEAAKRVARMVDMNSRAQGSDKGKFEMEVQKLVAEVFAGRQTALLDRLAQQQGKLAVSGWGATVHALQQAQVDTLVMDAAALADRHLLALDAEPWVATAGEEALDARTLGKVAAAPALLRAVALTDAKVELMAPGELDGKGPLAALLRWPTGPAVPAG